MASKYALYGGDYWRTVWPADADAVFTFMLPRYMARLDRRMAGWAPKRLRLASFAFTVPGRAPITERDGVFLYEYPPAAKK